MNRVFTHTRTLRLTATLGLAALFAGLVSLTPARADDDGGRFDRDHIRHDIGDIRRDQDRLHDLYRQRDREAHRRDWDDVRRIDRQITDLRWHIAHDRQDVHRDFDRDRFDRDRRFDHDDYRIHNRY